jgi:hypothetical protein
MTVLIYESIVTRDDYGILYFTSSFTPCISLNYETESTDSNAQI